MIVRFALTYLDGFLRGPEKEIELENPDPHPNALKAIARKFAESQTEKKWDSCVIHYNDKTIRLTLGEP